MDSRLLLVGGFADSGEIGILWAAMKLVPISIPVAFALSLPLATLGIAAAIVGVFAKGTLGFRHTDAWVGSGLVLGALGLLDLFYLSLDYEHTVQVCQDSKVVADPGSLWACPQVQASYYFMWITAFSLIIPCLLVFAVPILGSRSRTSR